MNVKLLTEHHSEFLSLNGDCRGSSKSTLVKMSKFCKISWGGSFYNLVARSCIFQLLIMPIHCSVFRNSIKEPVHEIFDLLGDSGFAQA